MWEVLQGPDNTLGARLIQLGVTFVLTTIVGGGLTSFFQHLSAAAHRERLRSEQIWRERRQVFEVVSRLLDRRLYALRQFAFALDNQERYGADFINERLAEYRGVLMDWNGSVNSNLALLEIYFGRPYREEFDNDLGRQLVGAGATLEQRFREGLPADISARDVISLMAGKIYAFNIKLLEVLNASR